MKKTLLFVFAWLAMTVVYGGGLAFAGGAFTKKEKTSQSREAEIAEVAEVVEADYIPRKNPNVKRASGNVFALPATALNPESERLPTPVYAVSGVRGIEINEDIFWEVVDIIVNLPEKESFSRGILEGEDVSDWIPNLPAGLEARAHGVKKGASSIKIYISGTPSVTARELIQVIIPGTYLTGGTARKFVSPTEEESFDSWKKTQIE
jgi:hypothetical protein